MRLKGFLISFIGSWIVRVSEFQGNNQSITATQLHAFELEFQFLFPRAERRYLISFVLQQF
jgi:hypothetical protein